MKYTLLLLLLIFLVGCGHGVEIKGHRLVFRPALDSVENIDKEISEQSTDKNRAKKSPAAKANQREMGIAMTNTGELVLCNVSAVVHGIEPDPFQLSSDWVPGKIWFLDLGEFNCRLPLSVKIDYQLPKDSKKPSCEFLKPKIRTTSIQLPKKPTAISSQILRDTCA